MMDIDIMSLEPVSAAVARVETSPHSKTVRLGIDPDVDDRKPRYRGLRFVEGVTVYVPLDQEACKYKLVILLGRQCFAINEIGAFVRAQIIGRGSELGEAVLSSLESPSFAVRQLRLALRLP